jgi:Tol biopolymer transport system component
MHRFVVLLPALVFLVLTLAAAEPETKAPKPVNLDRLNTQADEDEPYLAGAGSLYYALNSKGRWQLMVSTRRTANAPWQAGKEVDGYFSEKADNRGVCLTTEGRYPQYLYFATNKDPEKREGRGDNFDLYVTVRQYAGAAFTAPTPVQGVDTPDDEMHPWLSVSGKELYFSRKTKEGWRVYVATTMGAGAGNFTNPKRIDLPPDFHHATLTPDGKTMYLQGPLEKGRWGLFRSTATGGSWSKPEPLDDLNSAEGPTGDRSPALSRDGKLLYFASDRPGGKGGLDLWAVPTAELVKK